MKSFRSDRFLTLYFFYPMLRLAHSNYKPRITILMYHSISDSRREGVNPYYETSTSPQIFAEHMRFLYENQYKVINLQDIESHFSNDFGQKKVIITFDDGFRDFYTSAFPVLEKYRFSATVFLPTAFIGKENLRFKGVECLSWGEIKELYKNGIIFGSHTVNHYQLNTLGEKEVEYEIGQSKKMIEEELGDSINSFAYPFAYPEQDHKFIILLNIILQNNSYKYGVNTKIGTVSRKNYLLDLKRIPVNSLDDMIFFEAKLKGAYDWLYFIQKGKKLLLKSGG